jgi:uncharacterized integral membrane protein
VSGRRDAVDAVTRKEGRGWRTYVLGIAALLLAILVIQNAQKVTVDFLFVHTQTPLIIALLIAGGLGALIGWAWPHVRRSRRADRGVHLEPNRND